MSSTVVVLAMVAALIPTILMVGAGRAHGVAPGESGIPLDSVQIPYQVEFGEIEHGEVVLNFTRYKTCSISAWVSPQPQLFGRHNSSDGTYSFIRHDGFNSAYVERVSAGPYLISSYGAFYFNPREGEYFPLDPSDPRCREETIEAWRADVLSGRITLWTMGATNPLVAGFTHELSTEVEGQVSFTSTTEAAFDLDLVDHLWDFGDGTSSTERNPVHIYTAPGTYQVRLEVGVGGDQDTITHDVEVRAPELKVTIREAGADQAAPEDAEIELHPGVETELEVEVAATQGLGPLTEVKPDVAELIEGPAGIDVVDAEEVPTEGITLEPASSQIFLITVKPTTGDAGTLTSRWMGVDAAGEDAVGVGERAFGPPGLAVTVTQSPASMVLGRDNDADGDVDDDDAILELQVEATNITDVPIEDVKLAAPVEFVPGPDLEDPAEVLESIDEEPLATDFGTLDPGESATLTYHYLATGKVEAEARVTVRGVRNGSSTSASGAGSLEIGQVIAPVIFLPGVLGSEIWCNPVNHWDRIWPPTFDPIGSPGTFGHPVQEQLMLLNPDGTSNASSECPVAGPADAEYDDQHNLLPGRSGVVEGVGPVDAYGSGMTYLREIVGAENFYAFGWDWRKDTSASLGRLDALVGQAIEEARENQGLSADDDDPKVQLVAHSYGGLLALDYASDPARRAKLERVTTVGTPYLGAPKTVFSLLTGTDSAFANGWERFTTMQAIFGGANDVRSFAATARGLYNLWPAASYGKFLDVVGIGEPLEDDQIRSLITAAGGQPGLWDAAQAKHAALWDRLDVGSLPWHMVVSGGVPTISRIEFNPGGTEKDPRLRIGIEISAGDGTVPLPSQAMLAATNSGIDPGAVAGNHSKLSVGELCEVVHSSQMASATLYVQIKDWLLSGIRPSAPMPGDICRAESAIVIDAVGSTLNLPGEEDDENPQMPDPFHGASANAPRSAAAMFPPHPATGLAKSRPAAPVSTSFLRAASGPATADPSILSVSEAEQAGLVMVVRSEGQALVLIDPRLKLTLRFDAAPGKTLHLSTMRVDGSVTTPLDASLAGSGFLFVVSDGAGGSVVTDTVGQPQGPGTPPWPDTPLVPDGQNRPSFNVCTSPIGGLAGATKSRVDAIPAMRRIENNQRAKVLVGVTYKVRTKNGAKTRQANGTVVVCEGAVKLAEVRLKAGNKNIRMPKLASGKHVLTVRYLGNAKARPKDRSVVIKVKR